MSAYVGRYRGIADSLASERPIDLWVHDLSQPSTPTTLLRHPRCPRVRTRSNQSQSLARSLRISSRKALPFPRQGSIRDEKQTSFTDAADLLFVLRVLGSHQFSSGQPLRVILCSGKRTSFTILAVPFLSAVPLQTFHGETWSLLLSCARRRNTAAGVYLPARSFGGRPPSVSAATIAAIAAATFAFAELSCPAPCTSPRVPDFI